MKEYLLTTEESDPYSMFIFAMNAAQTGEKYVTRLRFFDFINLQGSNIQERCNHLVKKSIDDNRRALNNILKFLQFYKERVDKMDSVIKIKKFLIIFYEN